MSVDNRIVNMIFNNKDFEKGVKTTTKTLDDLDKKLKMEGASKGLNDVNNSIKKIDLSTLSNAVNTIASRFSTMGIVGTTALVNIANQAINTGKQLISSLTIDPIKTGFQEYETKMNAIQTILTNTQHNGTTIDQVNAALADLNTYADKTIYNFAEMTKNIGTFTAAGVDLETSTMAIKGIANLAAGSGSSAQQASTAMYQLSQAISAGRVSLQDWNSVVNAGMGGKLFQDALKETGRAMGAVIDETQSFRDSISSQDGSGWLTSDILLATLQKFANDPSLLQAATQVKTFTALVDTMKESVQSGWSVSWEHIIGNKDEAAELFTSISQGFESIVGPIADARNEMLKFWKENGGRQAILNGLTNCFNALLKIVKPIIREFREFFPKLSGEQLVKFSKSFEDLTKTFDLSWAKINKIKNTFAGLFAIMKIGWEAVKALGSMFGSLLSKILPMGGGLLNVTSSMGEWLVKLEKSIQEMGFFEAIVTKFNKVLDYLVDKIKGAVKGFKDFANALGETVNIDTQPIIDFFGKITEGFHPIRVLGTIFEAIFNGIKKVVMTVIPYVTKAIDTLWGCLSEATDGIQSFFSGNPAGMQAVMNGGLLAVLILGFKKIVTLVQGFIKNSTGFVDSIKGVFESLSETIESFKAKARVETLVKIATAIGVLAASLLVLASIKKEKLVGALGAMTAIFSELLLALYAFDKISGADGIKGFTKTTAGMILLSTAVLVLSSALKKIAKLNPKELITGLTGTAVAIGLLVGASKLIDKNSKGIIKASTGLIIFAAAIDKLVKPVTALGNLSVKQLIKGLGSVAVLITEITLMMKFAKFDSISIGSATGLLIFTAALENMTGVVSRLGKLSVKQLIKGLGSIGVLMAEIALFSNVLNSSKGMVGAGTGILIMSTSLLVMASAIEKLSNISIEHIGKGLLAIGGALGFLTGFANLIPNDMVGKATGIVILASSLLIVGEAIERIGSLPMNSIIKGLGTMAATLAAFVATSALLKGGIASGASIMLMSTAMLTLAGAITVIGKLSIGEIAKGLIALAAGFAIIGVAGLVIGPLAPVILALSGAITLLGLSCVAVGAGLLMFSAALTALSVSGVAGGAALVTVLKGLIGLLPSILASVAEGLVQMFTVLANSFDVIVSGMITILTAIMDAIIELTPKIIELIVTLLLAIGQALVEAVPQLVVYGGQLILGILSGILQYIGDIVVMGVRIVLAFIDGIASTLGEIIDSAFKLIISFINGLADAIANNGPALAGAALNLVLSLVKAIGDCLCHVVEIGGNIVEGLWEGIKAMGDWVFKKITGFVGDIVDGVKDFLGIHSPSRVFAEIGKFVDQGLVQGMDDYASDVNASAEGVAQGAVDSMSGVMDSISDILTNPDDLVITPIVDLSNIQNGKSAIDDLLSDEARINATVNSARASVKGARSNDASGSSQVSNDNSAHINNTFNITGNNSQDIADQVSRKIQRDIERRNAVWA